MSGVSVAVAVVAVLGGAVALLVARRRARRAQA